MTEQDIIGFDPSQLSVFTENNRTSNTNNLIYQTKPAESKSEDHVYRSVIKVIYSPFDIKHSVLEQQSYALHDSDGWLTVVSSLTINDTNCPIFKAWKKCHYAKKDEDYNLWRQAAKEEEGGRELFQKRFGRYVTIQVIKDINQPGLVGKYMLWKIPASIWTAIDKKQNPAKESGKPKIPVMDFLFGRTIDLEVTPGPGNPGDERYRRETTYTCDISTKPVSCTNPDGSPLLNPAEQAVLDTYIESMKKVWEEEDPEKREALQAQVNADPNTKQLGIIYRGVLEKIKTFCPDLNAELNYKPWDEATTKRVNNWIKIVLEGNDPAVDQPNAAAVAAVASAQSATSQATVTPSADPMPAAFAQAPAPEVPTMPSDEDDLPF